MNSLVESASFVMSASAGREKIMDGSERQWEHESQS